MILQLQLGGGSPTISPGRQRSNRECASKDQPGWWIRKGIGSRRLDRAPVGATTTPNECLEWARPFDLIDKPYYSNGQPLASLSVQ